MVRTIGWLVREVRPSASGSKKRMDNFGRLCDANGHSQRGLLVGVSWRGVGGGFFLSCMLG